MVILRPEPGASATLAKAREFDLEALTCPLFDVRGVTWEAPEPSSFDGLLLTSANAVRHAGDRLESLRGLKVYAVGEATAAAAREAGFDIAATGDAGIERLLGSIEADLKLLHLCSAERRVPGGARQEITPLVVYRSIAIGSPSLPELEGAIVLLHSPRAASRFAQLVTERAQVSVVAISEETASAAGSGWASIDTGETPNDDALLALAAALCNKPQP